MGKAQDKLNAYGVDALCDDIGEQKSLTFIATEQGVSIGSLLTWIEADSERSARVKEVRRMMARFWDERAETVLFNAEDEFGLKKAKELSHHYRWRAAKIAPQDYGERQQVEHSGKLGLESLIAGEAPAKS